MEDLDFSFALSLQQQFYNEASNGHKILTGTDNAIDHLTSTNYSAGSLPHTSKSRSVVDSDWELIDPTPDVLALFQEFNKKYFWERLNMVEVKWSKRMTLCAGLCRYEGFGGLCSIALSQPLLSLRPRKDLVETLLHEMIHAFLFVTQNNKDHNAHGPEFCKHMNRINEIAGCNITIYHSFHDEVAEHRKHWWRCQGPCQYRPPYFGYVKRAMNRAPSKTDYWWNDHERTCGGKYIKIKEPENYVKKGQKKSNTSESNIKGIPQTVKQHRSSKANPKSTIGNGKGIGNILGGNKVATVTGRGVPSTSRLLSTQPIAPSSVNVDSKKLDIEEKLNVTMKPKGVPLTSRRLSIPSSNSSLHSDSKKSFGSNKQKIKNDEIPGKSSNLSGVKKRENCTNDSPVRNKKKKCNLYDFFQQMKKSGRKSVNEGAPAFQSIKPVVSFSKRVVHFDDSDDESSDKENNSYSKSTSTSIQTDIKPKQEDIAVKIVKDTKHNRGDRIAMDLFDLIDDDVLFDEFDNVSGTANSDKLTTPDSSNNGPRKVKGGVLRKVKSENSAMHQSSSLNCDGDVLFRKRSKIRLPSFSDDDDETLTQVWQSHVESKKMKFDLESDDDSSDLPAFSMNNVSSPSLSNEESCAANFTAKSDTEDKVMGKTCNHNNSISGISKETADEITSEFRSDHCENDNVRATANNKESHDVSTLASPSRNTPETSHVSCPICGLMCSEDNIIQHVDDCLTSEESHGTSQNAASDENKGTGAINSSTSVCANNATTSNCNSKSASSNASSPIPTNEATSLNVSCPICGFSCSADQINYHVDECLSLKAINESDWN